MKKNYDFSNAVKNPYAKKLKKTICINISESVIAYFKSLRKDRYSLTGADQYVSRAGESRKDGAEVYSETP